MTSWRALITLSVTLRAALRAIKVAWLLSGLPIISHKEITTRFFIEMKQSMICLWFIELALQFTHGKERSTHRAMQDDSKDSLL